MNPTPACDTEPHGPHHQLSVVGESVAELVECAGAWMFDHARAGWLVTAYVSDVRDTRPLRILGVIVGHGLPAVSAGDRRPRLAVSAATLQHDATVARIVGDALDEGTDVAVWGQALPAKVIRRFRPFEHRLGPASSAFKAQALLAATGVPASLPSAAEVLFTNGFRGHASGLQRPLWERTSLDEGDSA